MIQRPDALVLTRQRIEAYMANPDKGGRNGPIVREIGRIAAEFPEGAYSIAEGFDPGLRASALTIIGRESHDIGPIVEAIDIINGTKLERKARAWKLHRAALAAKDIDVEVALEAAREIPWLDFKINALLEIYDAQEKPRTDVLYEAFDSAQQRMTSDRTFNLFSIVSRARKVDLNLTEQVYICMSPTDSFIAQESTRSEVHKAIRDDKRVLIRKDKDVVVRALYSALEEFEEDGFSGLNSLDPLEDTVKILRLFGEDPETHEKLVDILTRAAKATAGFPPSMGLAEDPDFVVFDS